MKRIRTYYPRRFWYRKPKKRRPMPVNVFRTATKGTNHLVTQTRSLLNRRAVRQFIKENGKYIKQVESTFYTLLEQRIKKTILKAIANNASRKRLTQYEMVNFKEVK